MSQNITFNGNGYVIPDLGEINWGQNLTDFFVSIPAGALQPTGGGFTLTAEVDFGGAFGLKSIYFKSRTANPAAAGVVRLANTDGINFRNAANSADLTLGVNGSNQLTFNGVVLESDTLPSGDMFVGDSGNSSTPRTISGAWTMSNLGVATLSNDYIVNAMINSAAAIAYSKLNLSGSIVNADINASAAIAYSKLNLVGSIVNADVNASAAIAYSKLNLSGSIVNADVNASAAIAFTKLAAATADRMVVTNSSGFLTASGWNFSSDTLTTGAQNAIRFQDSAGGDYVGFRAPASVTTHTYDLPIAAGTAGQVLSWQTGGQLQWINAAGGGTINTGAAGFFAYYPANGTILDDQTLLTVDGSTVKFTSTGGSGLRVYGGAGTNQWDVYLIGANIRFSDNTSGGVVIFDTAIHNAVGTASLPSIAFASDTDTGFYLQAANAVSASAGGVLQAEFTTLGFGVKDGTAVNPSIYFLNGDSDTGWYRSASGEIQMVNDGALVWKWNATGQVGTNNDAKLYVANGSAASPSYSFFNDTDTGWFGLADNSMRLSIGATQRFIFDSSTLQISSDSATLSLIRPTNSRAASIGFENSSGGMRLRSGNNGAGEASTVSFEFMNDVSSAATVHARMLGGGQWQFDNGSVSVPTLSFLGDTDTGFYRGGANFISVSCGGTDMASFAGSGAGASFLPGVNDTYAIGSTAIGWTKIYMMDGTAASPSFTFRNDDDTGMYRTGANVLSLSLAGAQRLELNGTSMTWKNAGSHAYFYVDRANTSSEGLVIFTTGAVGTNQAACGFDNDTTNSWHIFTGGDLGTPKITVDTGGTTTFVESIRQKDGSVSGPSYTFSSDTDLGIFRQSANTMAFTANANRVFYVSDSGLIMERTSGTAYLYVDDGSSASPGVRFNLDTDTGMFRQGANVIGWSCAGTQHLALTTGQLSPGATDGTMNIGSGSARWNTVFATNSTINTSHSSTKENIAAIDPSHVAIPDGVFFDRGGRRYMGYLNDSLPNEARPIENGVMLGTMNYENAVVGILCAHVRKLEAELAELKAASKFN